MDIPGTVTKRAEGNTFVRSTGLYFAGQTGFGMHTGFYLTNSGNFPIQTKIDRVTPDYPEVFNFPSGRNEPIIILPGEHKFVPINVRFIQDNIGAQGPEMSGPAGNIGPDRDGFYNSTVKLSSISQYDGSSDPSGPIYLELSGQVTGANTFTSQFPARVSGFLVKTDFSNQGKPQSILRWFHPETGYYVTRYRMEYAEGIDSSSVATGIWTGVQSLTPPERQTAPYYNIESEVITISNSEYDNNPVSCEIFADASGISQLYTRETTGNKNSNYAEFLVQGLGFGADYYYRVRPEYIHPANNAAFYGEWIYGYPVSDFDEEISNNEVLTGLASGCPNTLPPGGSASNIKNSTSDPQALEIYLNNGASNVDLYDSTHENLIARGVTSSPDVANLNAFVSSHADYAFSGVKFIVPQNASVGSTLSTKAGIETGDKIVDSAGNEVNSLLVLKDNCMVAGHGGDGGDGGFTTLKFGTDRDLVDERKINIKKEEAETSASTVGADGTAAIKITDSTIQLFRISKSFTSKIYGGGGGGGGGDPFFWPKSFTLNNLPTQNFKNLNADWKGPAYDTVRSEDTLTDDIEQQDTIYEVKLDFDLQGGQDIRIIDFRLSDVLGTQIAGIGGGGQGFGISQGGKSLYTEKDGFYLRSEIQQGSLIKIGDGSGAGKKLSPGGEGGVFGADGGQAANVNAGTFYRYVEDSTSQAGGKAGAAIESLSNTYTTSNFLGKLVIGPDADQAAPTEIEGLVAWWDSSSANASNIIKSTYGTTEVAVDPAADGLTNGNYRNVRISKWYAKNQDGNQSSIFLRKYEGWPNGETDLQPRWINAAKTTGNDYTQGNTPITKYLGKQSCMYFDGATIRAMQIENIIGSNKLEEDMDGFEIMYFLSPLADFWWKYAPFHPTSGTGMRSRDQYLNGTFRGQTHGYYTWNHPGSPYPRGASLHQWSDIGPGEIADGTTVSPAESYQNTTMFYDGFGNIVENAGIRHRAFKFRDFTNLFNPGRGWVYSISAKKVNGKIDYSVYNDTRRMFNTQVEDTSFSWMPKPIIGACSKFGNHAKYLRSWYGSIAHLCVFNKALSYQERKALVNYFLVDGGNVLASTDQTDENKRNRLNMENGYAGFNIFPS